MITLLKTFDLIQRLDTNVCNEIIVLDYYDIDHLNSDDLSYLIVNDNYKKIRVWKIADIIADIRLSDTPLSIIIFIIFTEQI